MSGFRVPKKRGLALAAVATVFAALVMLSIGAGVASAQCPTCAPFTGCVSDFQAGANCTANDVQIASMNVRGYKDGDSCAYVGDTAQVYLRSQLIAGANERYDVSMFVSLDGTNAQGTSTLANGGSCYHDYLTPIAEESSPTSGPGECFNPVTMTFTGVPCTGNNNCGGNLCVWGDPTTGIGPFYNGESTTTTPPDTCGDIQQAVPTYYDLDAITVKCIDADNDGQVDPISTCLGWDNQSNQTPYCTSVAQAYPNTKSKCKCDYITVPELDIRKIIVDKVTIPSGYEQQFSFNITGPTNKSFSLADQDPWYYATNLTPGTYSVAETVPANWTLSNDITETYCTDYTGTKFSPSSIDLSATPAGNREVYCRFTNRPSAGNIIVDKVVYPVGDSTSFDFSLTGGPSALTLSFSLADATTPYDTGAILPTTPGSKYNITESTPADWVLYSATCSNGSPVGAVTVAPGQTVTCTFVNSSPLAIRLVSFAATSSKNTIVVSWKTASETNNAGFNLYRATSLDGAKTKLNSTLIATKVPPGSNVGAEYSFTDKTVKKGTTYYYWLEDVSIQGEKTLHGPVQAKR